MNADTRFYVLEAFEALMFHSRWARASPEKPVNYGDALRCPVCGGFMSMLRWLPPYRIYLSSADPSRWGDFVWGAGIDAPLVSERFKTAYEQNDLKGILQFRGPVEIARIGKQPRRMLPTQLPTYYIADIDRMGPAADPQAEQRVYKPGTCIPCDFCQVCEGGYVARQERVVINTTTWSGEDIFIARGGPPCPVVSERFKGFVDLHQFTNCWLIPAEYYAYDSATMGYYVRPEALLSVEEAEFRRQFLSFWRWELEVKYVITRADRRRFQAFWQELRRQSPEVIVAFLQHAIEKMRLGHRLRL